MSWDRSIGRPEPIRALNRIREVENGEPLVDIREAAPAVRLIRPTTIPVCRATVAAMAQEAASRLPAGVYLAVTDAWRPFVRQARIYEWMSNCLREARPEISHATLRRIVCRWVAPVDQKAPPGHTTGAALDVNLVDEQNEPLDVSSPLPRFKSNPTHVYGLGPKAKANRMLLYETMTSVGFSNCRDEWWHYSYGDAGWAVRMGLGECFYGRVDLPESEYAEQQRLWEEAIKERPNPFLPA